MGESVRELGLDIVLTAPRAVRPIEVASARRRFALPKDPSSAAMSHFFSWLLFETLVAVTRSV
jgi:hypothetical protein